MSNPPSPPYTEATVELVAKALARSSGDDAFSNPKWADSEWDDTREPHLWHARSALDALVKAGLLLPEGAETRTDEIEVCWQSENSSIDRTIAVLENYDDEQLAVYLAAGRRRGYEPTAVKRRSVYKYADGGTYVTGWDAVRLAEGDSSKGFEAAADESSSEDQERS